MSSPRILIVGSGAVGAVYGHHLASAGCHVRFLVRHIKSESAMMPRQLHRLSLWGGYKSIAQHLRVQTHAGSGWDQIWICLPSDALDSDWLKKQLRQAGTTTPVILWSPALTDKEQLQAWHPAPVTQGMIGLVSFQCPLPGEQSPAPGIAYLAPPGSALIEKTQAGVTAAHLLARGGLPSATSKDLPGLAARLNSMLIPMISALEITGWSLSGLRKSEWLRRATRAGEEAQRIAAARLGTRVGRALPGKDIIARALLRIAPSLTPFPLETYLNYHFGKLKGQTRLMLDSWLAEAHGLQIPTPELQAVRDALQ